MSLFFFETLTNFQDYRFERYFSSLVNTFSLTVDKKFKSQVFFGETFHISDYPVEPTEQWVAGVF